MVAIKIHTFVAYCLFIQIRRIMTAMNILLRIITTLLLLSPLHSHTEDPYTVAKFQIDVANEMQQLSWISQMAYRLSDYLTIKKS